MESDFLSLSQRTEGIKTNHWKSFDQDVKSLMPALDEKIMEMDRESRRKLEHQQKSDNAFGDRLSDVLILDGTDFAVESCYAPLMDICNRRLVTTTISWWK
jgi:hypothetical protein